MDLQYFHSNTWDKWNRFTSAVEIPSKEALLNMLQFGTDKVINLNAGYSLVNPKDNYVKKVGREISSKRLEIGTYSLFQVVFRDSGSFDFYFSKESGNIQRHQIRDIVINISIKSNRPCLVQVNISKEY